MIHGERDVVTRPRGRVEHRIGGVGAGNVDPLGAQLGDRRDDRLDLLASQSAALAGMGVKARGREARLGDPEAHAAETAKRGPRILKCSPTASAT